MSPAGDPRTEVRRRDREEDEGWIRAFLHAAPFGFLATVDERGQPFLNANIFLYDEERHCLYLHTARTGRTRRNVDAGAAGGTRGADGAEGEAPGGAAGARVAFSVAGMGRLLPADEALEFSVEYAGVVCFGRGRVVEDDEEAAHALRRLLERYAPHLRYGEDYRAVTPGELKRTAVYRVDIEAWSGKQKAAAADFPGAFEPVWPEVPFRP